MSPVALSIFTSSPHDEDTEVVVVRGESLTSFAVSTTQVVPVSYTEASISPHPAGVPFSHNPVAEL